MKPADEFFFAFETEDTPRDDRPLRIVRGDEFLRTLRIPEWQVDGLIPRGQSYTLTGATGHAKTALATLLQVCIANGLPFAGRDVTRGRVLVLAGENPDDYGLRLLATTQAMRLKPSDAADIGIISGAFGIGPAIAELTKQVQEFGDVAAVFVDTSAAFFAGEEENANVQMQRHAAQLRQLCSLPGRPSVLTLCHPVKNATKDNLLPRGGGAFLAEVDGNLSVWREEKLVTLHWAGKIRGADFEPQTFELLPQTLAIVDSKGRNVQSVAVLPAGADRAEKLVQDSLSDENRVLAAMQKKPRASVATLASAAGMTDGSLRPMKSRAHRILVGLKSQGLTRQTRTGAWALTVKGETAASEVPL